MDLQHMRLSNDEKAYAFDHIRRWVVDGVTDGNDVPLGADYGITSLERADEIYFAARQLLEAIGVQLPPLYEYRRADSKDRLRAAYAAD